MENGSTERHFRGLPQHRPAVPIGRMLEQFARNLRGMPVDPDLQLNLLSSELTISS